MAQDRKKYDKKYQETNKEKIAAQKKAWEEKNKEKRAAINKAYNDANKEKKAKKDGLYTVYLLVNENYVGQTSSLHTRLIAHKSNSGRDVSNVQILGKYKTRKEAKAVEAEYHARGYLGYYRGH
tara:strand:+ start:101 stop:472 length:372 start_codon:yes stop_codon:yes gene_type:complete